MTKKEALEQEADSKGIHIYKYYLGEESLRGLYVDGNIALNTSLKSDVEEACVIAEELGHHHTTVGNILNLDDRISAKQERQARLWAYNKQIGLSGIIRAYEHGCMNRCEMAEFLDVTEEFLQEAIDCYREKYGVGETVDNYYIMFIPNLMVGKRI